MLVAQLCPALCGGMDCSLPGSSVHGILQARILEWVSHFLLQGIFLTQGSNLGLLHGRQTVYWLSHQGFIVKPMAFSKVAVLVQTLPDDHSIPSEMEPQMSSCPVTSVTSVGYPLTGSEVVHSQIRTPLRESKC